jgi:hypothetical protein
MAQLKRISGVDDMPFWDAPLWPVQDFTAIGLENWFTPAHSGTASSGGSGGSGGSGTTSPKVLKLPRLTVRQRLFWPTS